MLSDVLNKLAVAASRCATKPKNCEQCLYRTEPWRDGGHCYMFREDFDSSICGSFIAKECHFAANADANLDSRLRSAMGWLFSVDEDDMTVADARRIIRTRFGSDVDEELQRRYGS